MKIDKIKIATAPLLTTIIAVATTFVMRDCMKESQSVVLKSIAVIAASLVGAYAIRLSNKDGTATRTSRPTA